MPPTRSGTNNEDLGTEERGYIKTLGKMKGDLRHGMTWKLSECSSFSLAPTIPTLPSPPGELTGDPKAIMHWTEKTYAHSIVVRRKHVVAGWPWYANIPFANPSDIPGGQGTLRFLLALWKVGILRFEQATAEQIDLARRNSRAVMPGAPVMRPPPFCWGPFGTNQIKKRRGKGRFYPRDNPRGSKPRRARDGPKSAKLVLDESEGERDESEVISESDGE